MCDQCAPLRSHKHRHSPALANHSVCGACNLTSDTINTPHPCPACIVYALLHQNTFLTRWDDIITTAPPASPLQAHRSIHHPTPPPSALPINPNRPPTPTTPLPPPHFSTTHRPHHQCPHHRWYRGCATSGHFNTPQYPHSHQTSYHTPYYRPSAPSTRLLAAVQ